MEDLMSDIGILYTAILIFLVVMAILAFFIPLFVMQIRNSVIRIEKQMDHLVKHLVKHLVSTKSVTCPACEKPFDIAVGEPTIVNCPHCKKQYYSEIL